LTFLITCPAGLPKVMNLSAARDKRTEGAESEDKTSGSHLNLALLALRFERATVPR
jgi:hypothetical protein